MEIRATTGPVEVLSGGERIACHLRGYDPSRCYTTRKEHMPLNHQAIEEIIINSLKSLLTGRVNELLGEKEYPIPPVEFGNYRGSSVVVPVIALSTCERSEKERIVRLDAYTLTITFTVPEWPGGERNCYAYASTVVTALRENPTLGGVVDRAILTGKKYFLPKHTGTGEGWELVLTLRITIEEAGV